MGHRRGGTGTRERPRERPREREREGETREAPRETPRERPRETKGETKGDQGRDHWRLTLSLPLPKGESDAAGTQDPPSIVWDEPAGAPVGAIELVDSSANNTLETQQEPTVQRDREERPS